MLEKITVKYTQTNTQPPHGQGGMKMDSKKKTELFNEATKTLGAQVTYWPLVGNNGVIVSKNGKRVLVRGEAFVSNSGSPVVFLEGVRGYVSIDHVTRHNPIENDSHCYDKEFDHLWGDATHARA